MTVLLGSLVFILSPVCQIPLVQEPLVGLALCVMASNPVYEFLTSFIFTANRVEFLTLMKLDLTGQICSFLAILYSLNFFLGWITHSHDDRLPAGSVVWISQWYCRMVQILFKSQFLSGFNFTAT